MKALFTLATTTVLTWATATAAFAAPTPPATVNFSSAQGQPFSLVLDGRTMTNPVARQVRIGQLAPGRHWADFSLTTAYGQPMQFHTTVWLEPGLETSYVLVMSTYGPQLQRVSAVAMGSPAYGQGGNYNNGYNGGYQPQAQAQPQPPLDPSAGDQGNYSGTAPYDNSPADAAPTPAPGTYQPGTVPDGGYDPNAPTEGANGSSLPPLPADEVQTLTQELRNHSSDNARLDIAKQALAQNSVSAEELAQLLGTLNLDRSRIALAEFGYEHVSDPQNFAVVYEMFHLPASVQAVQQALGLPQE
ncbi:MAG: DUF4476 domain-containing protein [Janthinobacterium lividum]